ncbi:DUF7573 domain-containing protein [Halostagnicola kamekurae]|uniref:DUF7573 domain-containing protein n=1 Tax=Halostagnicola kamekurae TaxID=619731 RepID=A0A1I6RH47_9EURY|nr:hypothetical protein [Halostagnicola kamekurae]SFS64022.1 hypothetical protein SAMN04488556_1791 [Halostagnicola kamekurae]
MTEDATLSAFTGDEDAADSSAEEGASESDTASETESDAELDAKPENALERDDTTEPGPAVEPATSTYVWGSYTCETCSETVDRAWLEDGALVCPTCKDW